MSQTKDTFEEGSDPPGKAMATRATDRELERAYMREPAMTPLGGDEHLDARRLLQVLFERKWQILLVVLLVVVPAMIATLRQERLYRSTTLIEVAAEPVQVLPYRDVATPSATASYNLPSEIAREEARLKGNEVVSRVVERLKTHPEAEIMAPEIPRLSSNVAVTPVPLSHLISISYLASRPDVAATIANIWVDEFIKANYDARQETRLKARELLQRELTTLEKQVQASEQALVSYAQAHGLDPAEVKGGGNDLADAKLATLSASVTSAEAALIEARSRRDMLESATVENFPEKLITGNISGRQATLLQLEHDLTGLTSTFGPNWSTVVQKRNEVALVRDQLEREKRAAIQAAQQQALLDYRSAETKRRMLAVEEAQQEGLVAGLQKASVEYSNIRREVQTNEKLYEGLLERLKQTEVAPGLEFENVRVIERAQPNHVLAEPRILWNLMLAFMLGLGLAVSVAFGMEYWNDSLSTVEEAERFTGLPVLGTVPLLSTPRTADHARQNVGDRMGARGNKRIGSVIQIAGDDTDTNPSPVLADGLMSPYERDQRLQMIATVASEAVRSICASILLSRSDHPPKTLLVTSALPGEGKTTVARQLGYALAETGCRTLLIECDLRRPMFEKLLGFPPTGGLSLFLAGHLERPLFHQLIEDRFVIVTAGPPAPNPVALLHSEKMRAFLADMSRKFQFVILDAPPVLPIADARMLGALCEGIVMVARAGVTSRKDVRRACSALDTGSSRLLGMVLNGTRRSGPNAAYYEQYLDYSKA